MAPLSVGVLAYSYQAIDAIGPLDILGGCTAFAAEMMSPYGPVDKPAFAGNETVTHHIGLTRDPVPLSAGLLLQPTHTVDDAPELDVLVLGGPDPETFKLDPRFAELIRSHVAAGKLLFTNCTGAVVAAAAGALDGRRATVNHMCIPWARKHYPKTHWTMDSKWVVDGNVWTAGGAVAGMDMVSHWARQKYGDVPWTHALHQIDFEPRDVNGVLNVVPLRYDASGKQIATHDFKFYE